MKNTSTLFLLIALLFSACTTSTKQSGIETGVAKTMAVYRKANISNLEYQLNFDIPEDRTKTIQGNNKISFELQSTDQDLQIDFREDASRLHQIICNGKASGYRFESEHLIIPKGELIKGTNQIEIEFTAGNSSLNRNDEFLYTLFVPDRARTAFPCFDQPNLKAKFQLELSVPKSWKAIANGKIESVKEDADKSYYKFLTTKELPTYLFSFATGKFETITREHNGHQHTMYHRETDPEKLAGNTDEIFRLLFQSLDWLEEYTDIPYPFGKYDIVVIPSFQYGGMEHTGATLYNASKLFLDKNASKNDRLYRANLIAHETAHMWFGDLVTMKWFDQVWLKEVFANFLADKITNPSFPDMNHALKFKMAHFPGSYAVDRTSGANAINQVLPNLKDAGSVYGSIIYHKSSIVMDMLERITGEEELQKGLQTYLKKYAYGNASWEDLIAILDETTSSDLKQWSKVWVDKAGRPAITSSISSENGLITDLTITQSDAKGNAGDWNQDLNILLGYKETSEVVSVKFDQAQLSIPEVKGKKIPDYIIPNGKGNAYGFFKLDAKTKHFLLENMHKIKDDLVRGVAWINLYENLCEGEVNGKEFVLAAEKQLAKEKNALILERMLSYMQSAYWLHVSAEERLQIGKHLENSLWVQLNGEKDMSKKSSLFSTFSSIAESKARLEQLFTAWKDETEIDGFSLSETKATDLATNLSIKMPEKAEELVATQIERIKNPDRKKRLQFAAPALSANQQIREEFFASLRKTENREIERWVLDGLRYLNHPLREKEALTYLPQALELLEEIQVTGDIFFPANWLSASYSGLQSKEAGDITRRFLAERPDYPENLKLKILQATDLVLRKK
ncbi:M1 family aminopeptidase [Labilibaculum sp. K2S]|uniref:M1 family metallopeptidase n=1 Tax=Labilibaculum sp. K2S TaxID=3056386 RepID=UPI0025A498FA|nr:M1 family aminopeptidase [Labilibaculum sp. K2S]MDM8160643.1 M1 family aminopeptidase [Labilibaculum sp. K2S]